MPRVPVRPAVFVAIATVVMLGSRRVSAMNPAIIMIYGDTIQTPVIHPITGLLVIRHRSHSCGTHTDVMRA